MFYTNNNNNSSKVRTMKREGQMRILSNVLYYGRCLFCAEVAEYPVRYQELSRHPYIKIQGTCTNKNKITLNIESHIASALERTELKYFSHALRKLTCRCTDTLGALFYCFLSYYLGLLETNECLLLYTKENIIHSIVIRNTFSPVFYNCSC